MSEIIVSIIVAAVIAGIYYRYRSIFCLPFFWAAEFAFLYLGLLQIHERYGGWSFGYEGLAFGIYFFGLLAADALELLRREPSKDQKKDEGRRVEPKSRVPPSKPSPRLRPTRIKLLFPVLPLKVGLFVSLIAASLVTVMFFAKVGIPIFTSFPALAWVESTSGIINRVMTVFGPGSYATLGLVGWAIHRESGSRSAKWLMYVGLGLAVICDGLLGSKAAAIIVFVWFNILLYYMNKKRELRKTLLPLILVVVPISAAIVVVRMTSTQGYWQTTGVFQTYYDRLTTVAAEPLDFTFKYMNRFGPMHGGGLRQEAERIKDQLTGAPKTPVLSEFVYNLLENLPLNTTGLSAALTLQGAGYAEWGMVGLFVYSFLQGLAFGMFHRYLVRQEKISLISLVLCGGILSYAIGISSSGVILLGLETIVLSVAPPLALLLPFCFFFILPLARRHWRPVDRTARSTPQAKAAFRSKA